MTKNAEETEPFMMIVEDSDDDFEIMQRALRLAEFPYPIRHFRSGEQAIDFLSHDLSAYPSMVLLDLNLLGTGGMEVLRAIKEDSLLKLIPVIVLTTSNRLRDVAACYNEGANSYIIKPLEFHELVETIKSLKVFWFEKSVLPVLDSARTRQGTPDRPSSPSLGLGH